MAKASQRAGWRRSKTGPIRQETEFGSRGRERRKLLFRVSMLTTFAVALAIVLMFVLLRKPSLKVPLVASFVSASEYMASDSPLFTAPNPFAEEDVELLQAWFQGGPNSPDENVKLVGNPSNYSGVMGGGKLIDQITASLANATPGGPNGDMLMVYLSAHGFADGGKPFLATGESRADQRDTWVSFDELYGQIRQTLSDHEKSSRDLKLVLFVDAARVAPQWDWGQFTESFADACQSVSNRSPEQIAVILSADKGQRSWCDPRQGQGIFTTTVVEALTGFADRDNDGVVTVGEVADHVSSQTQAYAGSIWDALQTPTLLNQQAKAWPLLNQPAKRSIPSKPRVDVAQLRAAFDSVDQLWMRHNALGRRTHPPLAFDPLGWSALEKHLSRLDQLVLAGPKYRDEFNALFSQCATTLTEFENGSPTLPKESSLSELGLRDYFLPRESNTAEFEETVAAWKKKAEIAAVQVPLTSTNATRFLSDWITESKFDSKANELAAELLESRQLATGSMPAQYVESHFMRLLDASDLTHLSSADRSLIFASHLDSRKALYKGDLRVNFWIREEFDRLNADRLRSVDQVFSQSNDERAAGSARLQSSIRESFATLTDQADQISAAIAQRDQSLHRLPRIGETLLADIDAFSQEELLPDDQSRLKLKVATEALKELLNSLQLAKRSEARSLQQSVQQIGSANAKAQNAMNAVVDRLKYRIARAVDLKAGDARGLRQLYALLCGSGVNDAVDRQRIHNRLCNLLDSQQSSIGQVRVDLKLTREASSQTQVLDWMSIGGIHFWDYWMQAVGADAAISDASEQATEVTERESLDLMRRFSDRGSEFRNRTALLAAGQLTSNLHVDAVKQDPATRLADGADIELARRLLVHWDTMLRGQTILLSHAPREIADLGRARFELDQQLFLIDHARRTLEEFWCAAKIGDSPFCVSAAEQLLASRNSGLFIGVLPPKIANQDLQEKLSLCRDVISAGDTLRPEPSDDLRDGTLLKFVADQDVRFNLSVPDPLPLGNVAIGSPESEESKTALISDANNQSLAVTMHFPKRLPDQTNHFSADVFFRGLRRGGSIEVKDLVGGRQLVFKLPNYGPPVARVTRKQQQPERLMLVIDCSGSMATTTSNNGSSRLDIARNAVIQFLNGLDPNVEVGLIVFGSQYGFVEKEGRILPEIDNGQQKLPVEELTNGKRRPVGLIAANETVRYNPNFDVRLIRKTSPLEKQHLDALKSEIRQLGAIGVTPTYLAIEKAYEALGRDSGHIIVLTDGKPKVISTPDITLDNHQDAARAVARSRGDIKLTIVKYLDSDTELGQNFRDAKVLDAADGQSLLRYLQDVSVKPVVQWQNRIGAVSREGSFGNLIPLATWPPERSETKQGQPVSPAASFSIRARMPQSANPVDTSTQVRVQGGERFELELENASLTHKPFEYQGTLIRDQLRTEKSDASRFVVHAGPLGKRFNRQLVLQLAIESAQSQQPNGKFTPRPSDIWVELEGIDSRRNQRGRKQSYLFGIPEFKPDQPIPILMCRIDNFPQQFDKVDVKAWFRFGDQPQEGTALSLSNSNAVKIDSVPGVSFRTEKKIDDSGRLVVTVTESYEETRELASIRLLPKPLPQEASTAIYDQMRVVVREFYYDDPASDVQISVIDRTELQDESTLYAEGDVEIDIDSR
ncbi:VWA domain-containing protein [Stieleria sp. JC731]|uniref:vWA domain-containing protein n=1 Tax=Pirellulaceae TaxID=2691357 RepID=UPI001E40BFB2|nr:VWA domain-containing protein [Stieleria sp. JC731]MCC9602982.1 VWA domain-containing protein [Stieleria sp. JC731]